MNTLVRLQSIRVNARKNGHHIIAHLKNNHIIRPNAKAKFTLDTTICLFCSSTANLTREHVLPKWAFEKKADKFFLTTINGLPHIYNRTTIAACAVCNSALLNELEKYVNKIFTTHNLPHIFFSKDELENIIRWLEILDYKFQVFSLTTKFRASKKAGYIHYLSDFSLSVLDPNLDYSPTKVIAALRQSLKRITIKSKSKHINSLVVFKTSNKEIGFFHKNNDYIFLELPQKKIAVFYFYQKTFSDVITARDQALSLIKDHY